MNVFLVKL